MATSKSRSTFPRSVSPSGRFCSSTSSAFASSVSGNSGIFTRSASPTRISVRGGSFSNSPSVRFSIDRSPSPNRSIAASPNNRRNQSNNSKNGDKPWNNSHKKTCLCSPTTHPGSFRCSLHKNAKNQSSGSNAVSYHPHRLYARRSAMTNSLVRIGTVEGDLVKRALAALIRPSSHQQRRRCDFQPRPSRLSIMSKAEDPETTDCK